MNMKNRHYFIFIMAEYSEIHGETILDNGRSQIVVYPDFWHPVDGVNLFAVEDLTVRPPIVIGGAICNQNRDVGFFSDESAGYNYSGTTTGSKPLTPELRKILEDVNFSLETSFNGILVNRYTTGHNSIGAHSDDARGLDPHNQTVACLSYGAARTFRIRDKSTRRVVLDYTHMPGTLLVMQGDCQKDYTHEIPPQLRIKDERVSLTFRRHVR